MSVLSVFVDESGAGNSRRYLVSLVFHDQSKGIGGEIGVYRRLLAERGLPDVAFHASPLLNGHFAYEGIGVDDRARLLKAFLALFSRLPINYSCLAYNKKEFEDSGALSARMRRDIVDLVFDDLAWFQSFDGIEVFYDGGQGVVGKAISGAFTYALASNAVVFRAADPAHHVLAQAADLACAIEHAAIKYERSQDTVTDRRFFGSGRDFRRNFLRVVRRKRLGGG